MQHYPVRINYLINAPIDKVWNAITNKEAMKEWYFDIPDFDLKAGNVFNFYEPGGENKYHHRCQVLDIIPGKRFKHSWTHPSHSKAETEVIWELVTEENNTTRVFLTHDGLEKFADAGPDFTREKYLSGWHQIVGENLKNYVEKSV